MYEKRVDTSVCATSVYNGAIRSRCIRVWIYPVMLYLGLVAGIVAGNLAAHAIGIDAFRVFIATLVLIPPAIIGARLLYVWMHRGRVRMWDRNAGGLAMYGGVPPMILLSIPLLAAMGVGFGAFWDAASFTILTGIVFAKIGCLLNGCCGGKSRLGIPVQLLESMWAGGVLAAASLLVGRLPFEGALFLVVCALYGAGRFALESLREPEAGASRFAPGYSASLVAVVSALTILIVRWPR